MCQSLRTSKTSVLLTIILSTYLNKWVLQMAGCSLWLQDKTNIVIYISTAKVSSRDNFFYLPYKIYIETTKIASVCMTTKFTKTTNIMLYLHFPSRLPFSCSTRRTCRATAASTLTGSSLSEQRHWRTISKEVFKFCSFLNFSSQKCFNTHAACNRKKKTITEAPFLLNWFTQKKWNGLFF